MIRDGKPKGQRSEAIFGAIRALIKAGYSDDEITAVLVDPANRLSEKPLEKGPSWLKGEIDRARQKPDQDSHKPGPANTNADVSGQPTCLGYSARGNPLALASAHSAGKDLPDCGTARAREISAHRVHGSHHLNRRHLA